MDLILYFFCIQCIFYVSIYFIKKKYFVENNNIIVLRFIFMIFISLQIRRNYCSTITKLSSHIHDKHKLMHSHDFPSLFFHLFTKQNNNVFSFYYL